MELIITVIAIFAAFYSGFYFGYLKRENKPPESMPIVDDFKNLTHELQNIISRSKDEEESKGFYD
jgi:hypothetical protein